MSRLVANGRRRPLGAAAVLVVCQSLLACGGGGGGDGGDGGGNPTSWYRDADADGFGSAATVVQATSQPAGFVAQAGDCDDARADVHPGAGEVCDGRDQDCNGTEDEGLPTSAWYADVDGDRHGDGATGVESCRALPGHVPAGDDCDDRDALLEPHAAWYPDGDGDGFPDRAGVVVQCARPAGAFLPAGRIVRFDCDDALASVRPFARELPSNGIDDDCDPATPDEPRFGPTDYSGPYRVHGLTAGKDAPLEWIGWTSGTLTVAIHDGLNAVETFEASYFGGTTESQSPVRQVTVGAAGSISTADAPELWGMIALDDRTVAATLTELDGGASLMLYRRPGSGHAAADLAAPWSCQGIVVTSAYGDATWYRGELTVGDGYASGTITSRAGDAWIDSFRAVVAETGEVAWDHSFAQPGGQFALSENRELVAGVATHLSGGVALELAVRGGGQHETADLAGEWSFHALAAGSLVGSRSWGHGSLRVAADGTVEVVTQSWLEPGHAWPAGALAASEPGALTLDGEPSFGGQLSRNQELFVATWSDPAGADVLAVALRRRVPIARPVLEPAGAASASIAAAGGAVEAMGADGTRFRLEVPPGAVTATTAVTLTPVASFPGLPVAGALAGAVQLAPEGLVLQRPATLVVEPPAGSAPAEALGFAYGGTGTDRPAFLPAVPGPGPAASWAIPVLHFSGAGVAGGSAAGQADPDAAYAAQAAAAAQVVMADREQVDPAEVANAIEPIMLAWLERSIVPRIDAATSLGGLLFGALQSLLRWQATWARLGEVELCTDYAEQAALAARYLRPKVAFLIARLDERCAAEQDRCRRLDLAGEYVQWNLAMDAMGWAGFSCLGLEVEDLCNKTFCRDAFTTLPAQMIDLPLAVSLPRIGATATVAGEVRALCGPLAGETLALTSHDPRIVTVSGRTVTGRDLGGTFVDAGVPDMACLMAEIPVAVNGTRALLVTVHEMVITSWHPECNLLEKPKPYRASIAVRDDRLVEFSAYQEDGSGFRTGSVYTLHTSVPNPIFPAERIGRAWALEPTYDDGTPTGFSGSYDWGWMGEWNGSQQRFTGCHGYSTVTLAIDPPIVR